jgi:hypothetical protein
MNSIRPTAVPAPPVAPAAPERARPLDPPWVAKPAGVPAASLWELLTPDEQAFFNELASLGQLSYRPSGNDTPSVAPLGGRIDVRG